MHLSPNVPYNEVKAMRKGTCISSQDSTLSKNSRFSDIRKRV